LDSTYPDALPLPAVFATLRRLLEARLGKAGKREYVQVLRLIENFDLNEVTAAVSQALALGALGFDAVKHLVLFVSGNDRASASTCRCSGSSRTST